MKKKKNIIIILWGYLQFNMNFGVVNIRVTFDKSTTTENVISQR